MPHFSLSQTNSHYHLSIPIFKSFNLSASAAFQLDLFRRYMVFLKKFLCKREEKRQEKMKITKQRYRNLVQVKPRRSVYFCTKTIFESRFFWLIRALECLIWVILTMTKYHKNLLRDSTLSLLSIVNFFFFLGSQDHSENAK